MEVELGLRMPVEFQGGQLSGEMQEEKRGGQWIPKRERCLSKFHSYRSDLEKTSLVVSEASLPTKFINLQVLSSIKARNKKLSNSNTLHTMANT